MPNFKQIIISGKLNEFPKDITIERTDLNLFNGNWEMSIVSVSSSCTDVFSKIIHISTTLVDERSKENGFEITKTSVLKTFLIHGNNGAKKTENFEPIWFSITNPTDQFKISLTDAIQEMDLMYNAANVTIVVTFLFHKK